MIALAEQVRERFSAESGNWERLYHDDAPVSLYAENVRVRARHAISLLGDAPGPVLDLGCGPATVALSIPRAGGRSVFATDFAFPMLSAAAASARRLNRRLPLFAADAGSIPIASGSFAAVLALGVVEYSADPGHLIAECARILRRGGVLVVSHPNAGSPFVRVDDAGKALKNLITHGLLPGPVRRGLKLHLLGRPDRAYFNHRRHRLDPVRFEALLEGEGLLVVDRVFHTCGFGLLDGFGWNAALSRRIERRLAGNPFLERFGWTCIVKATRQ